MSSTSLDSFTLDSITVTTGGGHYPVNFASLSSLTPPTLRSDQRVVLVSDSNVFPLYQDRIERWLGRTPQHIFVMPAGEKHKNFDVWHQLLTELIEAGVRRNDCLIAFGGGVVGDLTGFAAASYLRGVDYLQVPTTLLAQVDSSVGGKTAINHQLGKNMVGAFYPPKGVYIAADWLQTLPQREFQAGLAEVIKYGVISDADFLDWLESHCERLMRKEAEPLLTAVKRSCEIKATIVSQDERETGVRGILNFGHTLGHALEQLTGYQRLLHGEAVAIGMHWACLLAESLSGFSSRNTERLVALLQTCELPTRIPTGCKAEDLLRVMSRDKKNVDDRLRLILPTAIGEVSIQSHALSAAFYTTLKAIGAR